MKYDTSVCTPMTLQQRLKLFSCDKNGLYDPLHKRSPPIFVKGGFGNIYKFKDTAHGVIALKHIQRQPDGGIFAQGLIEIRAQSLVNKLLLNTNTVPHFCPLLTYQSTEKHSILAMPYFEDGTLFDYLRRNKAKLCEIVETTLFQVTISLAWLQAVLPGFRHNDLKTENVLCMRDQRPHDTVDYYYSPVGRLYAVPTCGIWTYIADFGHAHCTGIIDSVEMALTCVNTNESNYSVLPAPGADLYYFIWSMCRATPGLRSTELGITLNQLYYNRLFTSIKKLPELPGPPPTETEILSLIFNRWETLQVPESTPFGSESVETLQKLIVRLPCAKLRDVVPIIGWFGGMLPSSINMDMQLPGHKMYSSVFIQTPDHRRSRTINTAVLRAICEEYHFWQPNLNIEEAHTALLRWVEHFVSFLDGVSEDQFECLAALVFYFLVEKPFTLGCMQNLHSKLCSDTPHIQEGLIAQFLWLHKLAQ